MRLLKRKPLKCEKMSVESLAELQVNGLDALMSTGDISTGSILRYTEPAPAMVC